MRIKDISEEQRPRERMRTHGTSVLSDAELLAILLNTGSSGENVVDVAQRVISKFVI